MTKKENLEKKKAKTRKKAIKIYRLGYIKTYQKQRKNPCKTKENVHEIGMKTMGTESKENLFSIFCFPQRSQKGSDLFFKFGTTSSAI